MQGPLGRFIVAPGDLRRHGDRNVPFLDGGDQALLPMLEQAKKGAAILGIEIGLARDFALTIATSAEVADLLNQLDLPVLAPG